MRIYCIAVFMMNCMSVYVKLLRGWVGNDDDCKNEKGKYKNMSQVFYVNVEEIQGSPNLPAQPRVGPGARIMAFGTRIAQCRWC